MTLCCCIDIQQYFGKKFCIHFGYIAQINAESSSKSAVPIFKIAWCRNSEVRNVEFLGKLLRGVNTYEKQGGDCACTDDACWQGNVNSQPHYEVIFDI